MAEKQNLVEVFTRIVQQYPDKDFYKFKKAGEWRSFTYSEFAEKVYAAAAALEKLGVKAGENVAILAENRVEWAIIDYALLHMQAVSVPIYPSLLENQVEFIIKNCDGVLVVASNTLQAEKLQNIRKNLPQVKEYIIMEGSAEGFHDFWELINKSSESKPDYSKAGETISPDTINTLIYTSGTTGFPKGVMLTHWNFLSNVLAGRQILPVSDEDIFLSFLPLSHVFERMVGHYLPMTIGSTIAYAESIDLISQNMGEIRPTIMAAVPRLYEKMHARILEKAEQGSSLKKKIFFWAIEQGKNAFELKKRGAEIPGGLKRKLGIAEKLVYSKLKTTFGGRFRFFVSGGAPLSKEIGEFFAYSQVLILEGYGLTETSPVITVNPWEGYKFGSPGKVIPDVELKIADDGEILTRGPHVMVGYYKNEEATKEVLDEDGWFYTGDIGYLDEDNFLFITDRKKNLIVTSGGKNIAPQPIENLLVSSKYIEQSVVIGDRRKFCSAVIVPNKDAVEAVIENENLEKKEYKEMLKEPKIIEKIREEIDRLSVGLASYETIKTFALIPDEFTIESDELTPTLKVKRRVVEKNYAEIIDDLYKE